MAGPARPGLDLIHQQQARLIALPTQTLEEPGRRDAPPAFPLDGLDQDGGRPGGDGLPGRLEVPVGEGGGSRGASTRSPSGAWSGRWRPRWASVRPWNELSKVISSKRSSCPRSFWTLWSHLSLGGNNEGCLRLIHGQRERDDEA